MAQPRPIFLAGAQRGTDHLYEVRNPYDGSVASEVHGAGPNEIEEAIAAATAAAPRLAAWRPWERAAVLERARQLLAERLDELADCMVAEAGKPISAARGEAARTLDTLTDGAFAARALTGSEAPLAAAAAGADRIGLVRRMPVGPVAAITPFNFPLNLVAHKIAPAVAAGCPIVVKPAPQAPSAALLLADILDEAGLPAGALSVLPTEIRFAGPLSADPRFRLLTFTGSPTVGWALKARAVHMRVLLELGGNAGSIVCDDADLDWAVERLAAGAFGYAGQTCISVQRIYVQRSIYRPFCEALAERARSGVPWGDPRRSEVVVGPLIRDADCVRVLSWIEAAEAGGASLLCGGRREGSVVLPTVLAEPDPRADIMAREVFGPVVSVLPFDDLDDAFAAVNDSPFGLQAGIFTADLERVLRAHEALEVGAVVHDDSSSFRVDLMPYGGVKSSGLGREGPRHAVYDYTEPRLLVLRRGGG